MLFGTKLFVLNGISIVAGNETERTEEKGKNFKKGKNQRKREKSEEKGKNQREETADACSSSFVTLQRGVLSRSGRAPFGWPRVPPARIVDG